jgi:hypothetical protein
MANDDVELREIDIELTGEGADEFAISEVTISSSVNSVPSCVIKGARADETGKLMTADSGAADYSLKDTSDKLSEDQNDMFRKSSERELTLKVKDDGLGNSMTFKGLSTAPGCSVSVGKVLEQKTIVHPDKRLSSLNLSIYELKDEYGGHDNKPTDICDPNLPEKVGVMLDEIVFWTMGDDYQLDGESAGLHTFIEDTHKQNKGIYDELVSEILGESGDTALSFHEIAPSEFGNGEFIDSISNVLQAQPDFFQSLLNSILNTFLFQYVCPTDISSAKSRFMHSQTNAGPGSGYYVKTKVDVINMSYGMGGVGELPLGQILVTRVGPSDYGSNTERGVGMKPGEISDHVKIHCGHPEKKTPKFGQTKFVTAPAWMQHTYTPTTETGVDPGPNGDACDRVADGDAEDGLQKQKDKMETKQEGSKNVLKDWAMKHYVQQALQNHTCVLETPLDIRWGCSRSASGATGPSGLSSGSLSDGTIGDYGDSGGRPVGFVYSVTGKNYKEDGGDILLFEGYLKSVVHNIQVGAQQGRATTSLTFTHVKGTKWNSAKMEPKYGCSIWVDA